MSIYNIYRVKLIAAGKVLNALLTLEDQNVKNNQTIMAVTLDALSPSSSTTECIYDRVQKARQDAELLMNQKSNFMEVCNVFVLPRNLRK